MKLICDALKRLKEYSTTKLFPIVRENILQLTEDTQVDFRLKNYYIL